MFVSSRNYNTNSTKIYISDLSKFNFKVHNFSFDVTLS